MHAVVVFLVGGRGGIGGFMRCSRLRLGGREGIRLVDE